jgi:hypothetical protein
LKILLSILAAGALGYLLLRLCLYFCRPFFLSKTFREIDQMYNRLMAADKRDFADVVGNLVKVQSGDEVALTVFGDEDRIREDINSQKAAISHEEQVHDKFLRLSERFIRNPSKLSESITAYRKYLLVRLKWREDAALLSAGIPSGMVTVEDVQARAKEAMIVLQENERRLDILLS